MSAEMSRKRRIRRLKRSAWLAAGLTILGTAVILPVTSLFLVGHSTF